LADLLNEILKFILAKNLAWNFNGVARGSRDLFLNNSWFVGFNKIKILKFGFGG